MKYFIWLLILLLGIGIYKITNQNGPRDVSIELGEPTSTQAWIYLCGLTNDFYSPEEMKNREAFQEIGKKYNIKFLAIMPPERCAEFDNKLCWPHDTKKQIMETYRYILDVIGNRNVSGFIGFSNGGFFLNQLAQYTEINNPLISIGAAGTFQNSATQNILYLLISPEDIHHYVHALNYYGAAQNSLLQVTILEYPGGHRIPFSMLENLLASFDSKRR